MSEIIHAKKGNGLDDIFKEYTPQPLEIISAPKVQGHTHFKTLTTKFQEALSTASDKTLTDSVMAFISTPVGKVRLDQVFLDELLTPSEIDAFLQTTIPHDNHPLYNAITGMFITRLVQRSYLAGYHDFTLHLPTPLHYLGTNLNAVAGKPLRLKLEGDVGNNLGRKATEVYFHAGKVGNALGRKAQGCLFYAEGDVGKDCGGWGYTTSASASSLSLDAASHSNFILKGDVISFSSHTDHCGFWLYDKTTIEKALDTIAITNKIVHVDEAGETILSDYPMRK